MKTQNFDSTKKDRQDGTIEFKGRGAGEVERQQAKQFL